MTLDDIKNICEIINNSTLRAHRRFLKSAQYAGLGIPESYVQSENFISLSKKYSQYYDIIMESRLIQLGFENRGNTDIVIGNFYEPANPIIKCIIEFKKLRHSSSFSGDLIRLNSILKHNSSNYCIISAYTSRSTKVNINNIIKNSIIKNNITNDNRYIFDLFRSDTVPTIGRPRNMNGSLVPGNPRYFSNVCIVMRLNS